MKIKPLLSHFNKQSEMGILIFLFIHPLPPPKLHSYFCVCPKVIHEKQY